MSADEVVAETTVATVNDPAVLLEWARRLEPAMHLSRRTAVLDRIEQVLPESVAPPAPEGRDWALELAAERAIDAARMNELTRAQELADVVLSAAAAAPPECAIAVARAREAQGRALAWIGTETATRRADRVLTEAAQAYRALGAREWEGYVTFWRANAVHLQNGDLETAQQLMRAALDLLTPDSPRRSTVLSFYADVLISLGAWPEAEQALVEGRESADRHEDVKSQAYVSWSRARMTSLRGDAMATERHLHEAERQHGDWFTMHAGVTFLADAAELLDRVGVADQAAKYLARARERDADDEFVRQADAALLARGGDPIRALNALQELTRGNWLEKRWVWRHTLLTAWASFRAGRDGAGAIAARAFDQAAARGGLRVAIVGEPELTTAMLPLAEAAGSELARQMLLGDRSLLVRLLGTPRLTGADGAEISLPAGKPGELVRLLAVHPDGLPVEAVADAFFPEVTVPIARNRLRQILARLRTAGRELVVRDEDRLRLVDAWVDVHEFDVAAGRVRAAHGARAAQLAYAALALWSGPPLPTDPYADWATELRERLQYRYLNLLDLIAADAGERDSHQEAITALTAALAQDGHDRVRSEQLAAHLVTLRRDATARYLAARAGIELPRG